jgi:hypothetical protein
MCCATSCTARTEHPSGSNQFGKSAADRGAMSGKPGPAPGPMTTRSCPAVTVIGARYRPRAGPLETPLRPEGLLTNVAVVSDGNLLHIDQPRVGVCVESRDKRPTGSAEDGGDPA